MSIADKILSSITDQALTNAVLSGTDKVGIKLGSDTLKRLVAATRRALVDMAQEQQNETALKGVIERQTRQFMRQCGIRPRVL